jgi:hypothetical protein
MKNHLYIFALLMGITASQQTFTASEPAKDAKVKKEEWQGSGGLDDYGLFKETEKICDICDEEVDKFSKKYRPFGQKARIFRESQIQMSSGLLILEFWGVFGALYTPWGYRRIVPYSCASSKNLPDLNKNLQKYLTLEYKDFGGTEATGGKIYKIVAIDGRRLPEPVERGYLDLSSAVVEAALQKHQERYNKEKEEQKTGKL